MLSQSPDVVFKKNCIFMMMEKMSSATGEFLRQMAFFLFRKFNLDGIIFLMCQGVCLSECGRRTNERKKEKTNEDAS